MADKGLNWGIVGQVIEEENKKGRRRGGEEIGVKELENSFKGKGFFEDGWNEGAMVGGGGFWGYMAYMGGVLTGGGEDRGWEKIEDAVFLGLERAERWDLMLVLSLKQKNTRFMTDALIKMGRYEVNRWILFICVVYLHVCLLLVESHSSSL